MIVIGRRVFAVGLVSLLGACAPELDEAATKGDKPGKNDAIDSANDPARFDPNLERDFDRLPASGEVTVVPWASSYWPANKDSLNDRWAGEDSPATKYAEAFGRPDVPDRVSRYVGTQSSSGTIPSWVGICEGWAAAAIVEPRPLHAVTRNGVTFLPGDIEGLASLVYARSNSPSRFLSRRCNETSARFDDDGRAVAAACRDTNPGALHIVVTNFLGVRNESFVEDRTFDAEVWNQPLRGYELTRHEEITLERAAELVGGAGSVTGETATLFEGENVASGETRTGSVTMPAAGVLHFNLTGTGDADLYVKEGETPTESSFTCRPYANHSVESCTIRAQAGTEVFWLVKGYGASSTITLKTTVPTGGATYVFNPAAVRFAEVEMTLKYITESGPGRTETVRGEDSTASDAYHYVLELDAAGEIIGGEYVGNTRRNHPDFLWLPTGEPFGDVAGVRYSDVKSLLEEASR